MEKGEQSNGFGIASLVLGIFGILLFWNFVGWACALLALIFAIVQRKRQKNGIATAGLILSIIGLTLGIVVGIFVLSILALYFQPSSPNIGSSSNDDVYRMNPPFYLESFDLLSNENTAVLLLHYDGASSTTVETLVASARSGETCTLGSPVLLSPGESEVIRLMGDACKFELSERYEGEITLEYTLEGSTLSQINKGVFSSTAI